MSHITCSAEYCFSLVRLPAHSHRSSPGFPFAFLLGLPSSPGSSPASSLQTCRILYAYTLHGHLLTFASHVSSVPGTAGFQECRSKPPTVNPFIANLELVVFVPFPKHFQTCKTSCVQRRTTEHLSSIHLWDTLPFNFFTFPLAVPILPLLLRSATCASSTINNLARFRLRHKIGFSSHLASHIPTLLCPTQWCLYIQ